LPGIRKLNVKILEEAEACKQKFKETGSVAMIATRNEHDKQEYYENQLHGSKNGVASKKILFKYSNAISTATGLLITFPKVRIRNGYISPMNHIL
jgi:hypothetical protein